MRALRRLGVVEDPGTHARSSYRNREISSLASCSMDRSASGRRGAVSLFGISKRGDTYPTNSRENDNACTNHWSGYRKKRVSDSWRRPPWQNRCSAETSPS
ncbi:hypothetical protein C0Z16_21895 [Paraburkholderia rhynchosiae]|uniref:Uncharacterized protein n=1 Tax=Paraburkholderia rhynchosiae TaxID=487049 RepID=A0ABX4V0V4_9BURK|nr:hypothetical protein C0Z16_21895 [Paraburkholderia rhynchosiae]